MMFDPFRQAALQNAHSKLRGMAPTREKDMSLDDLKKLSGVTNQPSGTAITGEDRAKYIRDNNIKPGTQEWFRACFAKPHLTGEDPFKK